MGGATITATSGQTTLTTVSLTDAASKGKFTLRGLPTPGSFTLTATLAKHASQTLSLTLASGQKLTGVQITLGTSSGSLDGVVNELPSNQPAAGVTVTATDGLLTVQSETQSRDHIGHWHIGGLPVPGTYTLTFSRADLTSQTVSVSLDANGNVPSSSNGTSIDANGAVQVSMQSATTSLSGTVSRSCGANCAPVPLGEATVTLNSGASSYVVTTASTPHSDIGAYRLDNLPPGTYTLTVSAGTGTTANSQVINLVAGIPGSRDITVNSPASITGTLLANGDPTTPLTGWTVFLYTAAQYPSLITRTVQTDSNGAFSIDAVDAGDYLIALSPTSDPAAAVKTVRFTVQPSERYDLGNITVKRAS
jgi:hypothetical protein